MIKEDFKLTDFLINFIKKHFNENNRNIKFTYTKVLLYT